jgi:CRP-like cAMP-binding protein
MIMKPQNETDKNALIYLHQSTIDLVELLRPLVTFEIIPAHKRLYFYDNGENMCYIIHSGLLQARRDTDEVVISRLGVPNIMGITNLLPKSDTGLFLETLSECEIAITTAEQAQKWIGELNAWELLANHISRLATNLFINNVMLTAPTAYEVMRFQLISLMREPEHVRAKISAVKYIQERTRLSRSTIMKILAQLRQGGYIELDDGVLKALNHLPAKY